MRNRKGKFKRVKFQGQDFDSEASVSITKCLPRRKCYKLFMLDSHGDGMSEGDGSYTANWNGEIVTKSDFGNGFTEVSAPFGNC